MLERCCQDLVYKQIAAARKYGNFEFNTTTDRNQHYPATLVDNETLQSILLTQILLETLNGVSVPRKLQGKDFAYCSDAREAIVWNLSAENVLKIKRLEEETGVNLDYYHKLNIINR